MTRVGYNFVTFSFISTNFVYIWNYIASNKLYQIKLILGDKNLYFGTEKQAGWECSSHKIQGFFKHYYHW